MIFLHRFRHVLCAAIAALGLYTLVGFIVAPYVIKTYVVPALAEKLHRPILLQDVEINPFELSVRLLELDIQEPDNTSIIGFDELFVNFETVSIFRRAYAFDEIQLVRPYVLVKIHPDGKLNLVGLVPPSEGAPPEPQPKSPMPAVEIGLFHIESGVLEFRDESKKRPVTLDVVPIELTLHKFSTKPGFANAHSFVAEFGEGETLTWDGTFTLEPLESQGSLALANIKLAGFWKKVQDQFKFDIRSGNLDVNLKYAFDTLATPLNLRLSDGKVAFTDLSVGEKGIAEPLVTLGAFTLDDLRLDLAAQAVTLGAVSSTHGRIRGWVQPDGTINYVPLFASLPEEKKTESPPSAESTSSERASRGTKSWSLLAKTVEIEDYGIRLEDRSSNPTAELFVDDIRFTSKDVQFPFVKPIPLGVELKVNKTGELEARGTVGMNPIQADLKIGLTHLALRPFQPYVNKFLQADLGGGEFNLNGEITYSAARNNAPRLTYRGNTSIVNFEVRDRMARGNATTVGALFKKPVLSWSSLTLNKVALNLEPTSIAVGEIEWRKPSIQAVVGSDGTLNLSRITGGTDKTGGQDKASTPAADAPKAAGKGNVTPIAVDTVKLVNMATMFIDESIDPPVITGIHDLSGTIKGLSSKEIARAKVSLTGKVDKIAPIKIHGQINPLSENAYTDLKVIFDNMNLIAASPYAGKYAGYPITKGKLYLDLMYQVSKKQLHAENKVVIDQFTFGDSTNSPDATSLPVRLAIALLKDRHGKIEIDLPVRGDMNEPDFRYGRVVLNALGNLITKVAASPFAAIGSLVGGSGEDLQYVAFDPGSAELTDKDRSKLRSLEKALNERPGLRLEVVGRADPKLDGHAIAKQKVEDAVLARYEKTNRKASQSPPSADRRLELLNELYIQQFGKQPMKREETAKGKSVERVMSGDEVREELVAKQDVTEIELRQLAQSRAGRIREFLVGENQANQGQQESQPNQENQVKQDDQADQEKQLKQEVQQSQTEETTQKDQAKQEDQVDEAKQDIRGKEAGQENHMSQDRVFLLEVELSGASGEQVRCQLNLSGA